MSWENLVNLQARFRRKLDFRDIYTGRGLADIAISNIYAMSENFKFNLIILERAKTEETSLFLHEMESLDILGPDVLLYYDTLTSKVENVMKISSRQDIRRTELDFMAFASRRPFLIVSFDPPSTSSDDDANYVHLIRLLNFSSNCRGLLLLGNVAGQDAILYA